MTVAQLARGGEIQSLSTGILFPPDASRGGVAPDCASSLQAAFLVGQNPRKAGRISLGLPGVQWGVHSILLPKLLRFEL
jgi:hypothetical protein